MNIDTLIETRLASRVTDRARNVFDIACRLAAVSGSRMVDTNHLLIGSLQEGNGVAFHVLKHFDVFEQSLRSTCGFVIEPNEESIMAKECEDEVGVAFDAAVDSLRRLGHNYLGTEHLLIGLTTKALKSSQTLERLGLDPQLVRIEVLSLLGCEELA
ncbi:MAG: hypothetical protein MUC43_16050 [Pirellula sp.]|jgi:ATP-dependent Clp protease ATP-binding subunit ClpC|nr:hypothetical protein [Pirellula sp.]